MTAKIPRDKENDYTGNRDKLNTPRPSLQVSTAPTPAYQWNDDGWVINVKEVYTELMMLQIPSFLFISFIVIV